jgi:hypothetical protein
MFSEGIHIKSNFKITARERGKIAPDKCVENHNIWVNLGREFLPKVVSPGADFANRMVDTFIGYMSFGIGGNKQTVDISTLYPTLNADYPGQCTYDKGTPTTRYLERPVMVTGTPGALGSGDWAVPVQTPPTLYLDTLGSIYSTVEYVTLFTESMIGLGGTYPSVPLSEAALMLYNQPVLAQPTTAFYAYGSAPAYINPTRPTIVAYNNFGPITKTSDITLELRWRLEF